jgi:hypothetical protein
MTDQLRYVQTVVPTAQMNTAGNIKSQVLWNMTYRNTVQDMPWARDNYSI